MNQRVIVKSIHTVAMLAMVFLLALGSGLPAQAQGTSDVKLTADAGLGKYCEQNEWLPVRISLENSGKDVEAEVQVQIKKGTYVSTYSSKVSLPTSSRKAITVYARTNESSYYALLISAVSNGKTLASTTLRLSCREQTSTLIGTITDTTSNLQSLGDFAPPSGTPQIAELGFDDLPERVEGWNALDILVLSGVDTGALSRAQRDALHEWVKRGGRLLVIGGPKWQPVSAGIADLLPVELSFTKQVSGLSELSQYLKKEDALTGDATISVGSARKGANVLVAQGNIPLIVEQNVGFGKVSYLAADPSLEPLRDWEGMQEIYDAILNPSITAPNWLNAHWDTYSGNQALSALEDLEVPSLLYIICWMAFYILMIGPISYLVLKRTKRNQLAWVTVPGLAIAFTIIAYTAGGLYRGNAPILNRLSVVQAWEGQDQAQVRGLVGLYSPNRATYTLQGDSFLLSPFEEGDWSDLQNGPSSQIPEIRVEASGMKSFIAEGTTTALPISHTLVLNISNRDPKLTGTVTNNSQTPLKNVVVFAQNGFRQIGDLEPGKTLQVSLSIGRGAQSMLTGVSSEVLLGLNDPVKVENARRLDFLRTVMATNGYYGPMGNYYNATANSNWGIYLMGWMEEPVAQVRLAGRNAKLIDTNLYITSLAPDVHFSDGPWKLTNGLLAWDSSSQLVSPYGNISSYSGAYSLYFKPAIPVHFSGVESLSLFVSASGSSNPPNMKIWSFVENDWVNVDNLHIGLNKLEDPGRYVGPNGETRLKVSGDPNGELLYTYFDMVVRP